MADDVELVQQVAQGDRLAFLSLYDRYAPRVFGLAMRILGETMAAQEATQDAFVKLWTRAASFNPDRGSLPAWLLTITRRTALDRLRLDRRRPRLAEPEEDEAWSEIADGRQDPEETRWRALHFAVLELPKEQRQVIELAFYQGLSHSQIAQTMGIPLGTVKTRLRLGMDKLRQSWLTEDESRTWRSKAGMGSVPPSGKGIVS